jgi:hypothetical protein
MDFAANLAQQKQLIASYEKMQETEQTLKSGLGDSLEVANYHLAKYYFLYSVASLSVGPGKEGVFKRAENELKRAEGWQQDHRETDPLPSDEEILSSIFEGLEACCI